MENGVVVAFYTYDECDVTISAGYTYIHTHTQKKKNRIELNRIMLIHVDTWKHSLSIYLSTYHSTQHHLH